MVKHVVALVTVPLFFLAVLSISLLLWIRTDCVKSDEEYALFLDAGSSGTRLYVYKWEERGNSKKLPKLFPISEKKISPGLSSFEGNTDGIYDYLKPLLSLAKNAVPQENWPVLLEATGGLRLLNESAQEEILQASYTAFKKDLPDLSVKRKNFLTIDGKDEGLKMWRAVNYLSGNLGGKETFAIHDWGGASTQMAVELTEKDDKERISKTYMSTEKWAGKEYSVYCHSYDGFGRNSAVARMRDNLQTNVDPCLPTGYSVPGTDLVGGSDYLACKEVVADLFTSMTCDDPPCAWDAIPTPTLENFKYLIGADNLRYSAAMAGLDPLHVTPSDFDTAAQHFCALNMTAYVEELGETPSILCFALLYIDEMWTRFQLPADFDQTDLVESIDRETVTWTLGSALEMATYGGVQPMSEHVSRAKCNLGESAWVFLLMASVCVGTAAIVFLAAKIATGVTSRRRYEPLAQE